MTREEARRLYRQGEEATVEVLLALSAEIEELKARLHNNTAKKKPASNYPDVDPATPSGMIAPHEKASSRGRRHRRPGRKNGHPGARRRKPERIDRIKEHKLDCCPNCQTSFADQEPCEIRTRYTEEIPQVQAVVTEHRIYRYACKACDQIVEAPVTDALPKSTIGLRTLVLTSWLHYGLGITVPKILRLINTTAQFKVTAGGLFQAWHRLAAILKSVYDDLGQQAKESRVLYADETGWRVNGITHWLHCFCNQFLAFYDIERSRGSPVIHKLLGEFFGGILVSDFWSAYNFIKAFAKQKCLVHLFRELVKTSLINLSSPWYVFAKKLNRLLRDAVRLRQRWETLGPEVLERKKARLHRRLQRLIGAEYQDKDCKRLVKRLRRHQHELFTFLDHPEVDWHNNHGERQLRPPVVARKNSGGNHSDQGAETQAIMMTVFFTLHLRNQNEVDTVIKMVEEYLKTHQKPTLERKDRSDG
jgi:transposase